MRLVFFFLLFSFSVSGQSEDIMFDLKIVDSNIYNGRKIVVFNDGSWDYLDELKISKVSSAVKNGLLVFEKSELYGKNWKTNRTILNTMNCRMALDSVFISVKGFISPVNVPCNSPFGLRWGKWHQGNDYAAPVGTSVRTCLNGRVRYAQLNNGGYGNLVIVRHLNGLETYYAHLSSINVRVNDDVISGDIIGKVGTTGHSTGPHLHFEARFFDCPINPMLLYKTEKLLLCSSSFMSSVKKGDSFYFKNVFNCEVDTVTKLKLESRRSRKTLTIIR